MNCPYCGEGSRVEGTAQDVDRIIRKRRCLNPTCRSRFYTQEVDIKMADGKVLFKNLLKESK